MSKWGIPLLLLVWTLVAPGLAPAADEPGQDVLHEVRGGDNLHQIAGYYYGDARQWDRIWQANRDQVRNPNVLTRGQWLRVPDATSPDEPYGEFVARVRAEGRFLKAFSRTESAEASPVSLPPAPDAKAAPAGGTMALPGAPPARP